MSIKNLFTPNTQTLFAKDLTLSGNLDVPDVTVNNIILNNQLTANNIATSTATINSTLTVADINSSGTIDSNILNVTTANIDNLTLQFPNDWTPVDAGSINLDSVSFVFSTYYDYGERVECAMSGQLKPNIALSPVTVYFDPPVPPLADFNSQLRAVGSGTRFSTVNSVVEPVAVFSRIASTDIGLYLIPSDNNIENFEVKFVYYK